MAGLVRKIVGQLHKAGRVLGPAASATPPTSEDRCAFVARQFDLAFENINEGSVDEIAVAGLHLRQMQRCIGLEAMLHIIADVLRGKNDVHADVAQRKVQHRRTMRERLWVENIRLGRRGGEQDQG